MGARILLAVFAVVLLTAGSTVSAADPELTVDFFVPEGKQLNANLFTYTYLADQKANANSKLATLTNINSKNFPILTGLGVSNALLQFLAGTVNLPHTHPRGSETIFVLEGTLEIGLLESLNNTLFTQTLKKGEYFVIPQGLVHIQINKSDKEVTAYASFSSSNPGRVTLPPNIFGSDPPIDVNILAYHLECPPTLSRRCRPRRPS